MFVQAVGSTASQRDCTWLGCYQSSQCGGGARTPYHAASEFYAFSKTLTHLELIEAETGTMCLGRIETPKYSSIAGLRRGRGDVSAIWSLNISGTFLLPRLNSTFKAFSVA